MNWGAIASIGAGALGGLGGMFGASSAADEQKKAQQKMIKFLKEQQQTMRADLAPYREFGLNALNRLQTGRSTPPPALRSLYGRRMALQSQINNLRSQNALLPRIEDLESELHDIIWPSDEEWGVL
jgi:hypothetical protein